MAENKKLMQLVKVKAVSTQFIYLAKVFRSITETKIIVMALKKYLLTYIANIVHFTRKIW